MRPHPFVLETPILFQPSNNKVSNGSFEGTSPLCVKTEPEVVKKKTSERKVFPVPLRRWWWLTIWCSFFAAVTGSLFRSPLSDKKRYSNGEAMPRELCTRCFYDGNTCVGAVSKPMLRTHIPMEACNPSDHNTRRMIQTTLIAMAPFVEKKSSGERESKPVPTKATKTCLLCGPGCGSSLLDVIFSHECITCWLHQKGFWEGASIHTTHGWYDRFVIAVSSFVGKIWPTMQTGLGAKL